MDDSTNEIGSGFDFPQRGMTLYEALPGAFTFDDLMDAAEELGIPSQEAVEHFRIMLREDAVSATRADRWLKNEAIRVQS